jgi:hypothetical protein
MPGPGYNYKIVFEDNPVDKARRNFVERNDHDIDQARVKFGNRRVTQYVAHADIDARRRALDFLEHGRQQHRGGGVRRTDREAPLGTRGIERFGGRHDPPHAGQDVRDRFGQFDGARGRCNAPRRPQKQGVVEQEA